MRSKKYIGWVIFCDDVPMPDTMRNTRKEAVADVCKDHKSGWDYLRDCGYEVKKVIYKEFK